MSAEIEWRAEIGPRVRQSGSEWHCLRAAARTAKWLTIALLGLTFAGAAGAQSVPTQEERQALAPTGNLRAALYLGGPTNVIKDPVSGEMKGVGYDLGKELARRMGIPYDPVIYQTPKLLVEDVNSGKWDVAFVAQDSDRDKIMNFTAVYLSLEHGYLVPSGSPIQTINDVDRPGIRVGVPAGGSVIAPLKRTLKNAEIIGVGMPDAAEFVKSGKVDVFAANKANLFAISDTLPGSRVLDGRFSVDRFALGVPKGREAGMAYVRKFIEKVKAEGLVKSAAEKAGVRRVVEE